MPNTFDFTPIQKPYFIPQWDGICRVETDPPADPAPTAPPTEPVAPPTDPAPNNKESLLQNPEGLISTLEKYKKFGNLDALEKAQRDAQRMKVLEAAIADQGIDPTAIPAMLQNMKAQEEQQAQFAAKFAAEKEKLELQFQQRLAEANKSATEARAQLLEKERADQIAPYFMANAKPEAAEEWSGYWQDILRYIEFEPDGSAIKQILDKEGKPLWLNAPGQDVKPATVSDLFDGIIDGKYGYRLQSALKPASSAMGGGAIRPSSGAPGGPVSVTPDFDYGSATPEQLAAIRQQNYRRK